MLHRFYTWVMAFAGHPKATWILAAVSFAESSFFPIPPDPLYMAMILEDRRRAWFLAFLCTATSVVGGLLGYYIGYALFETVGERIVTAYHLTDAMAKFQHQFQTWGFWIIAGKGLTPIPYKVVTIASGVAGIHLKTFITASIIARAFRFYLVAGLLRHYGAPIRAFIEKNLTLVMVGGLSILVLGYYIIKYVA